MGLVPATQTHTQREMFGVQQFLEIISNRERDRPTQTHPLVEASLSGEEVSDGHLMAIEGLVDHRVGAGHRTGDGDARERTARVGVRVVQSNTACVMREREGENDGEEEG